MPQITFDYSEGLTLKAALSYYAVRCLELAKMDKEISAETENKIAVQAMELRARIAKASQ